MSKHKHKKVKKSPRRFVRAVGLLLLSVGLFFSSMYGYRCLVEKVCESEILDRVVRHDVTILMPEGAIVAEVADTKSSRELGLTGREELKDGEAMLFVFDEPGRYGFWIKDMNFAVDIVWINSNGIVVEIERNVVPTDEVNPKIYMNTAPASYVIEMKAGESQKQKLFLGSKVTFAN